MKKRKVLILSIFCTVLAILLMLYPLIGNLMSEKHHSDLQTVYTSAVKETDAKDLTAAYEAAAAYNALLADGISNAPTTVWF